MTSFLIGAIGLGIVFLYGCVGEIIIEKSGHLNLGIPGTMSFGAAGGCLGVSLYMKTVAADQSGSLVLCVLFAILFAVLFAAFMGLIYAFLTVSLKCNQNVTGLTITTFGGGLTKFFMESIVDKTNFPKATLLLSKSLPFASKLGWFGQVFLSHGFLAYFGIALAIAVGIFLKKTRFGLNLTAVGENPSTADAVGINVTRYKYLAILSGSAIAGIGGPFYVFNYLQGGWEYQIEVIGWLAITLVIFTMWRPILSIAGSVVFGGLYILPQYVTGVLATPTIKHLIKTTPYVVTILVLIITSIIGSKETQPPTALGLPYFREDR